MKVHRLYLASKDTKRRSTFERTDRSADLPVTIEARDRVQWYVDPRMLGVLTKTHGNPMVVRPLIEYGPGNWKEGRVLRIRIREEHLPGAAPRFKSTFGYWVRTLRSKKGVGPFTGTVGAATVSTTEQPGPHTESGDE